MANPPRNRKRVRAFRRAPDGSAYRKCNSCGVSVAIALADLHECETKKVVVQRFRGVSERQNVVKPTFGDQPRSPFRVFMESFVKTCKTINVISIDQNGLDTWKNMSKEERKPYIIEAERVNHSYGKALLEEVDNLQEVNDEADSAMVGKFDQFYEGYEDYKNSYSFDSFQFVETE
ncbi:high mobility group B protein 7 [Juglans microcarpa x Juglans regia]|uniref:high mobility group B protein 7 n=1 Tax=Juglans microcarpa x Juglans regia TaxID=2249226 RepID=UPI001B7E8BFA|nr:high mobility group B protein 7 [Juglans microcarpa x Juglans regia]